MGIKDILNSIFNFPKTSTNIDNLIGKVGVVTKEIDNLKGIGEICINNNYWSSMNVINDEILDVGTKVKILKIRGVKLIVEKFRG